MLIFSPILSNLHVKGPLGSSMLSVISTCRFPGPGDLICSDSFPSICSQVILRDVWQLHSFTVSPSAFEATGWFELEAKERIARIKPVHLQRKDGVWSMPIFNGIQPRGRQEAASGLPGDCKSLKRSSSAEHRSFLLWDQSVAPLPAFRGTGSTLGKSCGPPGPRMQRGLRMDLGAQTWRCLRVRSWLEEAEQAVGDWYMVNEDFSMWLAC